MPKGKHVTLTGYVKSKKWKDGNTTLSFQWNEYTKKKFMEIPFGSFVEINQKNPEYLDPKEPDLTHYVSYKLKEAQTSQSVLDDDVPF